MATKTSKTNEGFKLVLAYENELNSKVDQIVKIASPSGDSHVRNTQEECIDKKVLTRTK